MTFRCSNVLALIPGRGGSKGVAKKNIRMVRDKPLVAHAIEAAVRSTVVDTVYVSSGDDEILDIGRRLTVSPMPVPDLS
jgi:CMP-N,N'-diacetyllegionaminic acid synthase